MIDTEIINIFFGALDYISIGAFVLRKDYIVLFWNRTLEYWTGISRSEIVGKDIGTFFPHLREPVYASRLENIFQGGPPTVFSSQLHKYIIPSTLPGGKPRIQHTIVTNRQSISGQGFYAIFAIHDVSDLASRIRKYSLLSQKLKESNDELKAFTYSVSHDLRAPLRGMSEFSKIVAEQFASEIPDKVLSYLTIIKDSALEMGDLLDGLLALSHVGRTDIKRELIKVKECAAGIFEDMEDCNNGKTEIILNDMPDCKADPVLFRQVLVNLLGNALKYSRHQEYPRIEMGSIEQNNECVYFIKDNGIGFDMKYADKIFGMFQRLHLSDQYNGTGVGLTIVSRIIKRHGGRIWVESSAGKGAVFYFTIQKKNNESGRYQSILQNRI